MKTQSRILCSLAIASTFALNSCNNLAVFSPNYLSVVISPRPSTIAVGASVEFSGSVSNNLSLPQWTILDSGDASAGTLTPISGSPNSILYTAPATPPIYNIPTALTQGTVTLQANVTDPPGTSVPLTGDTITFVITAPSITVGLVPSAATVALGSTQQFFGYAVGSISNGLIWQINGVTGGSSATGTINSAGTYVAPSALPMTGNTVTLTVISVADPTKTASAVITL